MVVVKFLPPLYNLLIKMNLANRLGIYRCILALYQDNPMVNVIK